MNWKPKPKVLYSSEFLLSASVTGVGISLAARVTNEPLLTALGVLVFLGLLVTGRSVYMFIQQTRIDRLQQQKEHEKLRRELSDLKSEPSPQSKEAKDHHKPPKKSKAKSPRKKRKNADTGRKDFPAEGDGETDGER